MACNGKLERLVSHGIPRPRRPGKLVFPAAFPRRTFPHFPRRTDDD
jgi:hypothetical protein